MKFFSAIFFCLFFFHLQAQIENEDSLDLVENKPWLNFLQFPDSNAQAHLFMANWQYTYAPWGKMMQTGGMQASFGINVARFFSDQFVLGFCVDLKAVKGLNVQHFSREVREDFNSSFNTTYISPADSARAYTFQEGINGSTTHDFLGNYIGRFGIVFSPFPQKYGGFLLSVKRGYCDFPVFGSYGNSYLGNGKSENILFRTKANYSVELTMKPYTFFKNGYVRTNDLHWKDLLKSAVISFYYERLNIQNGTFDGLRLDQMVNADFIAKYGIDHRFGVKVGWALY